MEEARNSFADGTAIRSWIEEMIRKFHTEFTPPININYFVASVTNIAGRSSRVVVLSQVVLLAAALDPRTKSLIGIPNDVHDLIWDRLKCMCLNIPFEHHQDNEAPRAPDPVPTEIMNWANMLFNGNTATVTLANAPEQAVADEINRYKNMEPISLHVHCPQSGKWRFNNPLVWWKDKSEQFPRLSILAQRFLSIPATSAPSERMFSLAGLTISNDKNRILPDNAEARVLLKHNMAVLGW